MPKVKISSCTVQLLDGTDIIVEIENLHDGSDLLDEVCRSVGIIEKGYFGLTYTHQRYGKKCWFDPNKPLHSQIKKASNIFKQAVQFYPPSVQMLGDEITRYHFVLQIREKLLTGEWSCALPTQALLASYVAQAEFGDYDEARHCNGYLNNLQFMPDQKEAFLTRVYAFHKKHATVTAAEADWMYLESARKIAMYGMNVYDILDADGNMMKLGVNVNGVHLLNMNTVLHTFWWPIVKKCHFHGQEIFFDLEYPTKNGNGEDMTVGFSTLAAIDSKRITRTCISYQQFAFHGKPKTSSGKAKSKGFRSKKTKRHHEDTTERECSHVSADTALTNFKRVDSARFSKRILQKSGDKSGKSDARKVGDNINSDVKTEIPKTIEIPIITETLASDNPTSPDEEENSIEKEVRLKESTDKNVSKAHDSDDEPVEVHIEDAANGVEHPDGEPENNHVNDEEYEDVTEEASPIAKTCEEVKEVSSPDVANGDAVHEEDNEDNPSEDIIIDGDEHSENDSEGKADDVNMPYDVEADDEIVIIEFEDIEEEIGDREKKGGESLLREIEKELQQSAGKK